MAEALITPDELRRITEEKEMEQLREGLEKKRKADEERHHLHDAFMLRENPVRVSGQWGSKLLIARPPSVQNRRRAGGRRGLPQVVTR